MADEASVSEVAYVDAIFDIHLKVGLIGSEECWKQGYVIAENRHPQYGLMGVGRIDPEGRFHLEPVGMGALLYGIGNKKLFCAL